MYQQQTLINLFNVTALAQLHLCHIVITSRLFIYQTTDNKILDATKLQKARVNEQSWTFLRITYS